MLRLLAVDGSEFCVTREFGALLAELIVKVSSLEELVLDSSLTAIPSMEMKIGWVSHQHHRQLGEMVRLIYRG